MNQVNRLLTLLSLTTVIISIERLSPTTQVLLQPYGFLHLHEALQMLAITAFSVVISFLLLRAVSRNFTLLQETTGVTLGCLFILGTYFYATGNGVHEVASFMFNQFCDTKHFTSSPCGSMYFNDYFFGNIVYFVGLGLSNLALVLIEVRTANEGMDSRNVGITLANGFVLALTFIAYDAFDRVLVGLMSTIAFAIMFGAVLVRNRTRYRSLPFTLYSALGFTSAAVVATLIRIVR